MPRVITFEGKRHAFPDDATDQEISAALKAIPEANAGKMPKARTWTDAAVDALPMVGGAIGGLVGGAGGTAFGMGVGAVPGAIGGAAAGGAAGESARQLINRARGAQAPATAGEAAKDIAESGAANAAMEGGGQLLGAGMKAVAPWLMAKAVKAPPSLVETFDTSAKKIALTLLNDGINVTEGGLAKINTLLRSTNDEIRALVDNSPAKVMKDDVLRRVDELSAQTMKTSANPTRALNKAAKVEEEFLDHPYYKGDSMPVSAAQDMKVGTYKEIGNAYGKPEKAQALKAVARGLKEEIETAVPSIAEKNARSAELMAAREAVSHRTGLDVGADPLGILWASHSPEMFIAGIIHKQPILKSLLARGAWNIAGSTAKVAPQVLRSAVAAMAAGQEDEK